MSQFLIETDGVLVIDLLQTVLSGTPINDREFTCSIGDRRASGEITAIAAGSPNVVTSPAHGLVDGDEIIMTQVIGVTDAKGVYEVNALTADTFQLVGSTGSGTFVLDGTPRWYKAVPGATNFAVEYYVASRGRYALILPGTLPIANKGKYVAIIDGVDFNMHIEHEFTGGVWK